jgi:hypothetical protein
VTSSSKQDLTNQKQMLKESESMVLVSAEDVMTEDDKNEVSNRSF